MDRAFSVVESGDLGVFGVFLGVCVGLFFILIVRSRF